MCLKGDKKEEEKKRKKEEKDTHLDEISKLFACRVILYCCF